MSKKIIALFLSALPLFAFFGCKMTSAARFEPVKNFSATAQAKKGDFSFACKVTCTSYEDTKMEFTSPPSLEGLSLSLSSDGIRVNAYGIADSFPAEYINDASPVAVILYAVRDGIFTARDFAKTDSGTYTANVSVGEAPVCVTYTADGRISKINTANDGFFAAFE